MSKKGKKKAFKKLDNVVIGVEENILPSNPVTIRDPNEKPRRYNQGYNSSQRGGGSRYQGGGSRRGGFNNFDSPMQQKSDESFQWRRNKFDDNNNNNNAPSFDNKPSFSRTTMSKPMNSDDNIFLTRTMMGKKSTTTISSSSSLSKQDDSTKSSNPWSSRGPSRFNSSPSTMRSSYSRFSSNGQKSKFASQATDSGFGSQVLKKKDPELDSTPTRLHYDTSNRFAKFLAAEEKTETPNKEKSIRFTSLTKEETNKDINPEFPKLEKEKETKKEIKQEAEKKKVVKKLSKAEIKKRKLEKERKEREEKEEEQRKKKEKQKFRKKFNSCCKNNELIDNFEIIKIGLEQETLLDTKSSPLIDHKKKKNDDDDKPLYEKVANTLCNSVFDKKLKYQNKEIDVPFLIDILFNSNQNKSNHFNMLILELLSQIEQKKGFLYLTNEMINNKLSNDYLLKLKNINNKKFIKEFLDYSLEFIYPINNDILNNINELLEKKISIKELTKKIKCNDNNNININFNVLNNVLKYVLNNYYFNDATKDNLKLIEKDLKILIDRIVRRKSSDEKDDDDEDEDIDDEDNNAFILLLSSIVTTSFEKNGKSHNGLLELLKWLETNDLLFYSHIKKWQIDQNDPLTKGKQETFVLITDWITELDERESRKLMNKDENDDDENDDDDQDDYTKGLLKERKHKTDADYENLTWIET